MHGKRPLGFCGEPLRTLGMFADGRKRVLTETTAEEKFVFYKTKKPFPPRFRNDVVGSATPVTT